MMNKPFAQPLACLLFASLAVVGCSGTEPTPQPPNIQGDYAGTWDFSIVRSDGTPAGAATCACTFSIPTQAGTIFYGRSFLSSPCTGALPLHDGVIQADGQIKFELDTDFFAGTCTITARPSLAGTYANGTISVVRTEQYDCSRTDGFRYSVTIRANVTRTSTQATAPTGALTAR
jgi:hypothetical protein